MIVKGRTGGKGNHARNLARHLQRTDENELVEILETDPAAPADLELIFTEMQMLTRAHSDQGEKGLYAAEINPRIDDREFSQEDWLKAVSILEEELGLDGHPRAIVKHRKEGREHIHVVWQRFNAQTGKLWDDSQNYRKHEAAARRMEKELELLPLPEHAQDRTTDYAEHQQSERSDLSPKERKKLITDLYHQSDNGKAFIAALAENGFDLARGDKTDTFVIIDNQDEVHSLVRQIADTRKKDLHDKLAPYQPQDFKSVEQIRDQRRQANEHPAPPRSIDQAADEIRAQIAEERAALEKQHLSEQERLRKQFEKDNLAAANRKIRSNDKAFRVSDLWNWRSAERRAARQKLEWQRLQKRQRNELKKLERDERRALSQLERQDRPQNAFVYAHSPAERSIDQVRQSLQTLRADERTPNTAIHRHTEKIRVLERQRQSDERAISNYQYHQEQSRALFRMAYKDAEAAYDAFRELARGKTLRDAQKALTGDPGRFGEQRSPIDLRALETASQSLRAVHYNEKKMFRVRARSDDTFDHDKAIIEHGLKEQGWRVARTSTIEQQITTQRKLLGRAYNSPDDRRLELMDAARNAATALSRDDYMKLSQQDRSRLETIEKQLSWKRHADRLSELQRSRAEREDLHARQIDRGDDRHP